MEIDRNCDSYFDEKKLLIPYSDDGEYLDDMFRFLDVCLAAACSAADGDNAAVSVLYENGVVPENMRAQTENAFYFFESRIRKSAKCGIVPRFERMCAKFGIKGIERFAAMLALSAVYDRKYEKAFEFINDSAGEYAPTYQLAVKVYRIIFGKAEIGRLIDADSALSRFVLESETGYKGFKAAESMIMKISAASYILNGKSGDPRLRGYASLRKADFGKHIRVREEQTRKTCAYLKRFAFGSGCHVMNIYGREGAGRRHIAGLAAGGLGFSVMDIDLRRLTTLDIPEIFAVLDRLYAECRLNDAFPCFIADTANDRENGSDIKLYAVAERISVLFGFAFWISSEKDMIFARTAAVFSAIELPALTASERSLFWSECLGFDGAENNEISDRYILTPADIKRSAEAAREYAELEGLPVTADIIRRAIRRLSVNRLGHSASLINAVFTWEDLVIDSEQKNRMKMICDQVRYRRVVEDDWGFAEKTPYGRGLCSLFYGSPGTGKTMAAQVMANYLGLDIYKIDLSRLTSKYIGETQKNIAELFDRAGDINAILFFDEADSLFARRSEVKDANDRYANADTAFLLQKLEEYAGITILATNCINNIDDAFKRRIKFMINFSFPPPDVRRRLWETLLPKAAKVGEQINFDFFAESFELSGSSIKEILTNSAYLAASEGVGIRNSHVARAVRLNFSKFGKSLTNEELYYL